MKSKTLRRYLLAGLVVWLPIVVTFIVLHFIVEMLDKTIALLPDSYHPDRVFGVHIPGLGVILSLAIILLTGIIATNYFGERLVKMGEKILAKIPLVRSIYNASKQVINALFASNSQAFRKVLLVEYPRKDVWSIAFLTGNPNGSVISEHTGEEMVSLFIPTTPNPTSGFLLMVAKREAIEVDMTVDEALKFIISLGVMQPNLKHANSNLKNTSKQAAL
ncbi:DUF502 domain-containing protein [Legionella jordanis]|uniref:Transmembrane protein n=1 Tax=Legionella jordanis TaxID=456 RepID=A0A0W0VAV2_9GAMM|nr:DUF502 domain-containing protein [Legionella jordanis]KTD17250.1 transmembrane protein [Legionella jordanis]RMX03364.1 DUF502 domain-containing protein [Legionella jordanis]RMX15842.1 DUF502 domain-containing protein [Legionella jordanis]VEH12552.1 transmembrane protein [Legionella jordanis]HAT8713373.1 DUF502 domain-containing protein [Legionella jordanis]